MLSLIILLPRSYILFQVLITLDITIEKLINYWCKSIAPPQPRVSRLWSVPSTIPWQIVAAPRRPAADRRTNRSQRNRRHRRGLGGHCSLRSKVTGHWRRERAAAHGNSAHRPPAPVAHSRVCQLATGRRLSGSIRNELPPHGPTCSESLLIPAKKMKDTTPINPPSETINQIKVSTSITGFCEVNHIK